MYIYIYTHILCINTHKLIFARSNSKIAKADVCTPAGYVLFYKLRGEGDAEEDETSDGAASTNGTQSKRNIRDDIYS